jgi:hypothetical protein
MQVSYIFDQIEKNSRPEIRSTDGAVFHEALQYKDRVEREGRTFDSYGILFVPNPYGEGRHHA